jgi:hypothetical protein
MEWAVKRAKLGAAHEGNRMSYMGAPQFWHFLLLASFL